MSVPPHHNVPLRAAAAPAAAAAAAAAADVVFVVDVVVAVVAVAVVVAGVGGCHVRTSVPTCVVSPTAAGTTHRPCSVQT